MCISQFLKKNGADCYRIRRPDPEAVAAASGLLKEAEQNLLTGFEIRSRALGEMHPNTASTQSSLGWWGVKFLFFFFVIFFITVTLVHSQAGR